MKYSCIIFIVFILFMQLAHSATYATIPKTENPLLEENIILWSNLTKYIKSQHLGAYTKKVQFKVLRLKFLIDKKETLKSVVLGAFARYCYIERKELKILEVKGFKKAKRLKLIINELVNDWSDDSIYLKKMYFNKLITMSDNINEIPKSKTFHVYFNDKNGGKSAIIFLDEGESELAILGGKLTL